MHSCCIKIHLKIQISFEYVYIKIQSLDLEEVLRYAPTQLEECADLLHDLQLGKRAAAYEHTRVTYISEVCETLL